ncbi:MAG: bifunctional PIG-L family deacetylase/class I SAM-dependent methyltransferase [Burkholderiaceae bacterium]|nr:bifunctional PIG-L family deacetylase/class I SAM-dependent methyltransferase [Microbacteriaceae bacterium]
MVTFDHRDAGTSEEAWLSAPGWLGVPALVLDGITRLVVVAAHPDDESLGAGGLMARAAALGIPVHVVVATDGQASHPAPPTTTRGELARRRRLEVVAAIGHTAPAATIDHLGLPDGELRQHREELAAHLESLGLGEGALVVAPWRHDGHGDHEAAGAEAARVARSSACQLLEYPVWMWHWATPADERVPWTRLAILSLGAAEHEAKLAAITEYTSQNRPLSNAVGDEVLLDVGFHEHFSRPFEVFVTPLGSGPSGGGTSGGRTLSREFFDEFYAGTEDPWGFESRWYEMRKRALTVASLPRPLFSSGLEIGCSIGVLTADLAGRCASLVATDISEQPLGRARERLIEQSHVTLVRCDTPVHWPAGSFDLIVLSEVAYYWSRDDLDIAIDHIDRTLSADGVLIACHWRHSVEGYPERGDDVHTTLTAHPGFEVLSHHEEEDFLLDVLVRRPAISVARASGLLP